MKNISQHIEELLTKHECIIVPELGGFVVYQDNAKVAKNTLTAPCKKIRFNALLSYHDGLLAESIMNERAMNYSAALAFIHCEVEQMKTNLNNGNCVAFGKIGNFIYNNDNLIFTQNSHNFLPDNLGLPVVHLKKLNKDATLNNPSDNKTIVINLPELSNKVFKYAASIIIIFTLTLFSPPTNEYTNMASLSFDSLVFNENKTDDNISNNTLYGDTETITIDSNNDIEQQTVNYKFHVIIASLPSRQAAEQYISEKVDNTLIIIEKNNKFRISEQGFSSYNEALLYFNTEKDGKGAWILCL